MTTAVAFGKNGNIEKPSYRPYVHSKIETDFTELNGIENSMMSF